jgi:hypothetical protein
VFPRKGDALGVYEKLRLLGEGSSGRTWLARDRARDRPVVLKEPLSVWQTGDELRKAVITEARLAARIRHPNVVRVEDLLEHEGRPVLVLQYKDGGSLEDLLRSKGTLPWQDCAAIIRDVLSGLEAVHAGGIVHRDVKPSNVLLSSDGSACIGDFGVSVRATGGMTIVEGPRGLAGTIHYMAPEVANGVSIGDRRSDVFSCAAMMYECLYGTAPTPGALVVVREDVPDIVTKAILKGLAPDPGERHQSAAAFAAELSKVITNGR